MLGECGQPWRDHCVGLEERGSDREGTGRTKSDQLVQIQPLSGMCYVTP